MDIEIAKSLGSICMRQSICVHAAAGCGRRSYPAADQVNVRAGQRELSGMEIRGTAQPTSLRRKSLLELQRHSSCILIAGVADTTGQLQPLPQFHVCLS